LIHFYKRFEFSRIVFVKAWIMSEENQLLNALVSG